MHQCLTIFSKMGWEYIETFISLPYVGIFLFIYISPLSDKSQKDQQVQQPFCYTYFQWRRINFKVMNWSCVTLILLSMCVQSQSLVRKCFLSGLQQQSSRHCCLPLLTYPTKQCSTALVVSECRISGPARLKCIELRDFTISAFKLLAFCALAWQPLTASC